MFEPVSREFLARPDAFERAILDRWTREDLLARTLEARAEATPFVFYEGPPTANGKPGIHHLLARALKDSVCRFRTMRGFRVERKAGWDTHGLPVELQVERQLGIDGKPQIEEYGIAPFNRACRDSVFTYKEDWEELSRRMGYLLDYEHPYVTFHADYVESVWFLLSRFARNGLLDRGHKVLPWCGRCGTALSSHEVGQGYQDLDDPSVWITFPLLDAPGELAGAALVAWTTTPWTLPSNMGACVHPDFDYALIEAREGRWLLLESKAAELFGEGNYRVLGSVPGRDLAGLAYEPLFRFEGGRGIHEGSRFHVVVADPFVSDEEGTGIVHLAPYGADDFRIAREQDLRAVLAVGEDARFLCSVEGIRAGTFFRDANRGLTTSLKGRGRLLRLAQCRHSYPHCWRCDTPLLYFPAPAWFLRTTSFKERMLEENRRIQWVPTEIGVGRFGEWLANNVDWALSRDRYWGTPLPIWVCDRDPGHWHCVESFAELGELVGGLPGDFDPHRPCVDALRFPCRTPGCSGSMSRVPQVIDCWFDSGAMPYAQHHWPFENRALLAEQFPADFIAEGLDQTRGWFYTLHAIATFLTCVDESLWASGELWGEALPRLEPGGAYRACLVNGLLLDKEGRKMSKRLGNIVDPAAAIREHGVDAIRWSLLSGGAAHLSRRYDDAAITEARRRVLGTLGSSYDFLALYARAEGWDPKLGAFPSRSDRPAMDRWILSRCARCARDSARFWESFEPGRALRAVEGLIVDEVSNWYIRRNRRRFWGGEGELSQAAAFATLYEVLDALTRLIAPAIPFLADALWERLHPGSPSVHLSRFPDPEDPEEASLGPEDLDPALEQAMDPILRAASLGRSVRERLQIRVRQPLSKLIVHINGEASLPASPRAYEDALREELNTKEVEWVEGTPEFLEVDAKPNFPRLGKRAGKDMKALAAAIAELDRETLFALQAGSRVEIPVGPRSYELSGEDVMLTTRSVEGLEAATDGSVTIGLVTTLTPELEREGLARELVNRIQSQRKESGLEVSDRIRIRVSGSEALHRVVEEHGDWIAREVLAPQGLEWGADVPRARSWKLPGGLELRVALSPLATEPA